MASTLADLVLASHQAITVPTLADLLDIEPRTVRRAIGRGEIRVAPIGRSVRVAPDEVDRLLGRTPAEPVMAEGQAAHEPPRWRRRLTAIDEREDAARGGNPVAALRRREPDMSRTDDTVDDQSTASEPDQPTRGAGGGRRRRA